MRHSALVFAVFILCAAAAQGQVSSLAIDTAGGQFLDANYGVRNSPLLLDEVGNNPINACEQLSENPQLSCGTDGSCLISAIGVNKADSTYPWTRGESPYMFQRLPTGSYRRPKLPALAFQRSVAPALWNTTGGFGGGMAIFKTDRPSAAGYQYFGAINLGNFAQSKYGFVWAGSADGQTWHMLDASGNATQDPNQAYIFIHAFDYRGGVYGGVFWHPTGYYNPADQNFYLFFGLEGLQGIHVQLVRLKFHPETNFGVSFADMDSWVGPQAQFMSFSGVYVSGLTDPFALDLCGNREAFQLSIDAESVVPLVNQDGSDGGMIFIYLSSRQAGNQRFTYRYSPTITPQITSTSVWDSTGVHNVAYPFPWGNQQAIDTTVIDAMTLTGCGPGGVTLALGQIGWQANGKPLLTGFVTAATQACPVGTPSGLPNGNTPGVCGVTSLIPVTMLVK